jgi:hypothetical protein
MAGLNTSAKELVEFLHGLSDEKGAAFISAVEEFSKCNASQAEILLGILRGMVKQFGVPTFIKYNANKREHIKGVEPFSLHGERVRFELGLEHSGSQADICLARSTTPGCSSRDPLLKLRCDSGGRRLLLIHSLEQVVAFINGSKAWDGLFDENEVAPAAVPRRSVPSSVMTFNERDKLLPKVKNYLKKRNFYFEEEYEQPHGRFDIYIHAPEKVLIELKYINLNENALEKLRYAIGQILIYAFDPRGPGKIERLWVVTNECKVSKDIKKALKKIQQQTSINFFQLHGDELLDIDNW